MNKDHKRVFRAALDAIELGGVEYNQDDPTLCFLAIARCIDVGVRLGSLEQYFDNQSPVDYAQTSLGLSKDQAEFLYDRECPFGEIEQWVLDNCGWEENKSPYNVGDKVQVTRVCVGIVEKHNDSYYALVSGVGRIALEEDAYTKVEVIKKAYVVGGLYKANIGSVFIGSVFMGSVFKRELNGFRGVQTGSYCPDTVKSAIFDNLTLIGHGV